MGTDKGQEMQAMVALDYSDHSSLVRLCHLEATKRCRAFPDKGPRHRADSTRVVLTLLTSTDTVLERSQLESEDEQNHSQVLRSLGP